MILNDRALSANDERSEKRRRICAILDAKNANGVLLASAGATAWYLDGARTHVSLLGAPVLAVEVRRDGDRVYCGVNEAARLREEELPHGVEVVVGAWDAWMPEARPGLLPESAVEDELREARTPLMPSEVRRFSGLSSEVATAATDVLREAAPEWTEVQLAARLVAAVVGIGADPGVLLVAGETRIHHRHPLPTHTAIGRRAMAVVGARRDGLITNLTRWIRFSPMTDTERRRQDALYAIESQFLRASRPGAELSEAFLAGTRAYAAEGYSPGEWKAHHQGGVAGYVGRDPRATASTALVIKAPTAVAWNPSVPGGKIEDTVLVTAEGLRVLTSDPRWPTVEVDGLPRPEELLL